MQLNIHRRLRRAKWCAPLLAMLLLLAPTAALAHPLGNFTVNSYSRLELSGTQAQLLYIVDMAEIPAFQEMARIDTDGDKAVSEAERDTYLASEATALASNLHLALGGTPLVLEPHGQQLDFPPGQGSLRTLRITLRFVAALPAESGAQAAEYRDDNFARRIGWREIIVRADDNVQLLESSVPSEDVSQELRNYPRDMLQSPLHVEQAIFRFQPTVGSRAQNSDAPTASGQSATFTGQSADRLAALIAAPTLSWTGLLLAILTAFVLGAAHALSPGHGKTIVAAYLVGARGTARHAVFLGLTTTVTHTAGVFALGLVTLFVSEFILPEQLYPWLGVASGVLVFSIGISLFSGRLRRVLQRSAPDDHSHDHAHDDALTHTHGGSTHSHAPPGANGSTITWRSLLALGVSGGLLPCPSALVVLLGAIALGRVGFGLLLIVAFSVGLASVLTAIGILLVHAGRLFQRIPSRGGLIQALPIVSALIIAVAGLGITAQALVQTGLL